MKNYIGLLLLCATVSLNFAAIPRADAAAFQYSAWIPFWSKSGGLRELTMNTQGFKSLSPFSYEVRPDGTLIDKAKINGDPAWTTWLSAAQDMGVKIIPTVAWFDGDGLDKMLSNKKTRANHVKQIVNMVVSGKFNGVDIDYENKLAETKTYFSSFIKELSQALKAKKKTLACTVEPRTPVQDKFRVIPKDLSVANDYKVLNTYCDEVRVMAYDQGRIDLNLNDKNGTTTNYAPVADPLWVEKVIKETLKEVARSKVVLGIPTYGYEWKITPQGTSTPTYTRIRSYTYHTAMDKIATLGVTPVRNSAGEMSFAFTTSTTIAASGTIPASATTSLRYVSFTDATAIQQKIDLAKKYKLKGVVLFKVDGENDPSLWDMLKI